MGGRTVGHALCNRMANAKESAHSLPGHTADNTGDYNRRGGQRHKAHRRLNKGDRHSSGNALGQQRRRDAVIQTQHKAHSADYNKAGQCPGSNLTVTEIMQEKVMSIGENMQIRRFTRFDTNTSVAYVHAGGTHGGLVNLAVEGDIDATEIGKNVAMQIAAMKAQYWDKSLVPQEAIDKELAVQVALMDNDPKMANKPAQIKEKIAAGKMAAFFKEICLLQQDFVRSDLFQGDVAGYIADAAKKLGGKVTFVNAIHYTKGEGIEKKVDDFAAEVAAQVAGAKK